MRKKIVAGNWKMNMTSEEGKRLVKSVIIDVKERFMNGLPDDLRVVIAPPFIFTEECARMLVDVKGMHAAAQNCHPAEKGAFTGEISAVMIKSAGADYVIIGHSERRAMFAESNAFLAQKVDAAIKNNLSPIFCCGEILDERKENRQLDVVEKQLNESLFHLPSHQIRQCVIAYEPVWAIGTGLTASPEQAQEMHAFIRSLVEKKYGKPIASDISILYGGSCNGENAKGLFSKPDVDGGLIGGASLKAAEFIRIITAF